MVNALPDVRTDYEFQWYDGPLTHMHVSMKQPNFDLRATLLRIVGVGHIFGTKITVPGTQRLSGDDFMKMSFLITPDIKLVHLSRTYLDCFLSGLRDAGHLRNPEGLAAPPHLGVQLKTQVTTDAKTLRPGRLDIDAVKNELSIRFSNDLLLTSLAQRGANYMAVDYGDVEERFADVARHIGSEATDDQISEIVRRPATKKLPEVDYSKIFENFDEARRLGDVFEARRKALINSAIQTGRILATAPTGG